MDKKNMKTLVAIFGGLAVVTACGLGWDAYEKNQWMKRHVREMEENAETVRNWTGNDTPHLKAMKESLDQAEKIMRENGDLKEAGRLLTQSFQSYAKATSSGEPKAVRMAFVGRYYELNDRWIEMGCSDMQQHPENWK